MGFKMAMKGGRYGRTRWSATSSPPSCSRRPPASAAAGPRARDAGPQGIRGMRERRSWPLRRWPTTLRAPHSQRSRDRRRHQCPRGAATTALDPGRPAQRHYADQVWGALFKGAIAVVPAPGTRRGGTAACALSARAAGSRGGARGATPGRPRVSAALRSRAFATSASPKLVAARWRPVPPARFAWRRDEVRGAGPRPRWSGRNSRLKCRCPSCGGDPGAAAGTGCTGASCPGTPGTCFRSGRRARFRVAAGRQR
jgi:hypothetical protein